MPAELLPKLGGGESKMDELLWALFEGLREVADTAKDVADPKGMMGFF